MVEEMEDSKLFPREDLSLEGFRFKREIRDPIYGYIYITLLENEVIDRPEFQRLDRLYQTYATHQVYPSSTHTRKAHALGVMYLAHRALIRILRRQAPSFNLNVHPLYGEPCIPVGEVDGLNRLDGATGSPWWDGKSYVQIIQALRLAALLHDIGHAPFCHTFEDACNELAAKLKDSSLRFNHEEMGVCIVSEKLAPVIEGYMNVEDVLEVMRSRSQAPPFLHEIVDGPYDVDKLDYLNRDSYHAGTLEYGSVDHERIIDGFRVKDWRLLISRPAVGALLDSFIALQHMYANVYYHRTSRIFEFMIYDALSLMPELLRSIVSSPDELLNYDDLTLIVEVKHKRNLKSGDRYEEAYQIFRDVLDRRKRYATIYEHRLSLRTVSRREAELEKLKRSLEESCRDVRLRVDCRAEIRPIGVDLTNLLSLLEAPMIVDEEEGKAISLREFSDASYRTLSRYQIVFHIFADRKKTLSGKYDGMLSKVKREAEAELSRIEAEEEA
jgi:hypothetical protein